MSRRNSEDKVIFGVSVGFIFLWILGVLATLGFWGVVIWAIIELVQHFTS